MADLFDHLDTTPTGDLSLEELRYRLLRYFRTGQISIALKGPILGFAAAMKRGTVSDSQIGYARKLVGECRYEDGTEPVDLIDRDDVDGEDMFAEFK